MTIATYDPTRDLNEVHLSQFALHRLLKMEQSKNDYFRIYITGGGCSGFQYGFKFDSSRVEDDSCFETNGVRILVDSLSIQYLGGAEVDFKEDLMGAKFIINNPNAQTTCSCGASFSI